ncbi:aminotransferase [Mesorhizobium sp. LHD-90]|uniref:aminotransferase n=1 Tax=Mesorhizobium sp. LHD-90 TaxID=3071414 RepID=UPI0027DF27F9|nr:aminotransferase [Mesorhizobium sp. LHD-90]MDQ6433224.1 aminotransferase [Mesorhizobium sp. LHD-90]
MKPTWLADRDIASVMHPYTNLKKHLDVGPVMITRGEGIYLYDENDRALLDGAAGQWCSSLGYGKANARIAKVASDALIDLPYSHIFRHQSHKSVVELSEKLLALAPVPMSKVMLQCSGSEANDTAVKMVWYYWAGRNQPQRRKIISRMGSYHGSTCASLSLTGNTDYYRSFGLPLDGFLKVSGLNYYRTGLPGETEDQFTDRLAKELEDLIVKEGPDTIAAFWADPVQGNAGALPPPKGYFEKVQKILKKYDIVFVVDEVICGFGRTGEWWGTQRYGLEPDIITSAKGLSSAMQPISAVLVNEKIFSVIAAESDRLGSFIHGYTYAGHPVTTAVTVEVIKVYEELDIVGHVKGLERQFQAILESFRDHPLIGNVSGVGLLGGLEMVKDKETKTAFPKEFGLAPKIEAAGRSHGVLVRVIADRLVFAPPLIITAEELDKLAAGARAALDDVYASMA